MCVFMCSVEINRVLIPTFRGLYPSCSFFSVSPLPQIKRILHCIAIMYLTHILTKLSVLSRMMSFSSLTYWHLVLWLVFKSAL